MKKIKLNSLDLNLLLVFDAIVRTRNISIAAEDVGLTQSSTSNALSRLREYFNDALFMRLQGSMQPTPLAQQLIGPVQKALHELRDVLQDQRHFDPASSTRSFGICMSEVAQRVFLPRLLSHCQSVAPHITFSTVDFVPDRAQAALASGEIDLAIGYFTSFGDNYYSQRLFKEDYVALLRKNHPALKTKGKITLKSYLDAAHVAYLPAAASHSVLDSYLDREFANLGAKRRVGLRVAHSMGLSSVVEHTDLIATIPSRLAQSFQDQKSLGITDLPIQIPSITIAQHWHSRFHNDPGNQWLRSQFQVLFQA